MRSCDDGYPSCRSAEANGEWCKDECMAAAYLKEIRSKAEQRYRDEMDERDRMALKHPQERHEPRYAQAERDHG